MFVPSFLRAHMLLKITLGEHICLTGAVLGSCDSGFPHIIDSSLNADFHGDSFNWEETEIP